MLFEVHTKWPLICSVSFFICTYSLTAYIPNYSRQVLEGNSWLERSSLKNFGYLCTLTSKVKFMFNIHEVTLQVTQKLGIRTSLSPYIITKTGIELNSYFWTNGIFHLDDHLGFHGSPSVVQIYEGSFRNYKPYRKCWYMIGLVPDGILRYQQLERLRLYMCAGTCTATEKPACASWKISMCPSTPNNALTCA